MKNKVLTGIKAFGLAAIMLLGLVSIIGSGGGDGGGGVVPGGDYTGNTSQAMIEDIVMAEDFSYYSWVSAELGLITLMQIGEINGIDIEIPSEFNEQIPGNCYDFGDPANGFAIFTGSIDSAGNMTAAVNFDNFCVEGLIIDGSATLTGKFDTVSEVLMQYSLTFDAASFIVPEGSLQIDGTFSVDFATMLATIDYVQTISYGGETETYWLDVDITFDFSEGNPWTDFTEITGRYYDYHDGYVELSVGNTIRLYDEAFWPSSGTLLLAGSGGTEARLTFLADDQFQVDADTNGDGEYDVSGGPYSWDEWAGY